MDINKKILILSDVSNDLYKMRREVIRALLDKGYELSISAILGENADDLSNMGCRMFSSPLERRGMNPISDIKLFLYFLKLLSTIGPDLVLTYTIKPNLYGGLACTLKHIPYISNITGLGSAENTSIIVKFIIKMLYKLGLRKSSCIFFQNEENMKSTISRGLVHGEYELIPGSGVNTEYFVLQPYPNDSDKIVFNYIGRVFHDKGIDDYIAAAVRINKEHANTEFNIIGFIEPTESHYEADLKELQKNGIVFYRGYQSDVRPLISKSHATIHPSTYKEGISNVLLESAASGRPIITTDNPGCRETVDQGVNGFIYHGGNVDELVEIIESFLTMDNADRRAMGEKGREKVKNEFSRNTVVKAYLNRIANILEDK